MIHVELFNSAQQSATFSWEKKSSCRPVGSSLCSTKPNDITGSSVKQKANGIPPCWVEISSRSLHCAHTSRGGNCVIVICYFRKLTLIL